MEDRTWQEEAKCLKIRTSTHTMNLAKLADIHQNSSKAWRKGVETGLQCVKDPDVAGALLCEDRNIVLSRHLSMEGS